MRYIEARDINKDATVLSGERERTVRRVRQYPKRKGEDFHRLRIEFKGGGGMTVRERCRVPAQ